MDTTRHTDKPARSYTRYNGFAMPMNYLDGSYLTATSYGPEGEAALRSTKPVCPPLPLQFDKTSLPGLSPGRQVTFDYINNQGVFSSTVPNVKGNYIIHPDWVSETKPGVKTFKSLKKQNN